MRMFFIALLGVALLGVGSARAEGVAGLLRHVANGEDLPEARLVVVASSSLNRLDRDSAQLMRAMEMTTASTVGQVLSVFGVRQAIDMDRPFVAVMEGGPDQIMMLIPTRDGDALERAVRAEMLEEATGTLRFEFAGMPMVARRIDDGTIAVAREIGMLNRLLRAEPREGAWHAGVPGAGLQAIEQAPLAVIGERLDRAVGSVNLGFGIFDQVLERPGVVVLAPGPLGLRVDWYAPDELADGAAPGAGEMPLRTLRREGAFVVGQVHAGHPLMQGVMPRFVQRVGRRSTALKITLVRAAMPLDRIGFAIRMPSGANLLSVTGMQMLTGTTVHWTSADPAGDVTGTLELVESLVAQTPGGAQHMPRFEYNAEGLAAADRTLASWSLFLPNGRFGGTNFNEWRRGLIGMFPPQAGAMTLRGDVSWRDGLGSATFMRAAEEAIVDHRACPPAESFDADPVVNQVRRFLPENRVAEVYVDMRVVLEGVMPMLDGAGMGFALPAVVPPMGMALGTAEGHLRGGMFVPAIALRPVGGLAMQWLEEMAVGRDLGVGQER